jgi:RNA polymerase-interacting CarD/CdnL/TRCF family regulator
MLIELQVIISPNVIRRPILITELWRQKAENSLWYQNRRIYIFASLNERNWK